MNRNVSALLVCLALTAAAGAEEEKIALDKLPVRVTAAVKEKFKDAELVSASKEIEVGKTLFEVQLKSKGQAMDVTVTEDGTIVEVEKEITARDLPKAVTDALDAKYPKSTFKKVEEITKGDKMLYEVLLETADKKRWEVVLDAAGKIVETEDKTGKDDDKDEKKDK